MSKDKNIYNIDILDPNTQEIKWKTYKPKPGDKFQVDFKKNKDQEVYTIDSVRGHYGNHDTCLSISVDKNVITLKIVNGEWQCIEYINDEHVIIFV